MINKSKFIIILFLLFLGSKSFAKNEIRFQIFTEIIKQNVAKKIKIIEQDPLDAQSYFNLGLEYMTLGKTEKEIKNYLETVSHG